MIHKSQFFISNERRCEYLNESVFLHEYFYRFCRVAHTVAWILKISLIELSVGNPLSDLSSSSSGYFRKNYACVKTKVILCWFFSLLQIYPLSETRESRLIHWLINDSIREKKFKRKLQFSFFQASVVTSLFSSRFYLIYSILSYTKNLLHWLTLLLVIFNIYIIKNE